MNERARKNQSLIDHLREVEGIMKARSVEIGLSSPLIPSIGLLHDLLKANPQWQTYLDNRLNNIQCDKVYHTEGIHEFVEDPFIIEMIRGHHTSFQTPLSRPSYKPCSNKEKVIEFMEKHNIPLKLEGRLDVDALTLRMIFSLLIDADRQSASQKYEYRTDLTKYKEKFFDRYYRTFNNPKREIDKERCKVFEDAKRMGKNKRGIYGLLKGTGLGKTLSGMGFSLTHAVHNQLERIIIVPPFKAIIENASTVYKQYLDDVLVHHSDVLGQIENEEEIEQYKHDRGTWYNPIIVTTAVQLFYSLFSNRPTPVRKLNRIANSLIVIDEPQLLPDGYLDALMGSLQKLVKEWNCSVLFTTATPSFYPIELTDKIEYFIERKTKIKQWEGNIKLEDIAITFKEEKQGLLVVRTKDDCKEAYDYLSKELDNVYWIRGDFCHDHRKQILTTVKERLEDDKEVYLIGTQLIEAGVDLDFRVGFAQQCSLHSLVQIMGRVGRNNKRNAILYYGQIEHFKNESMFSKDKNYQNNQIKFKYSNVALKKEEDIVEKVKRYNKMISGKINYDIERIIPDENNKYLQEVNDKIKWIQDDNQSCCPLCANKIL
jgi:CRISPR-associated endonuclease/helicase Cas3